MDEQPAAAVAESPMSMRGTEGTSGTGDGGATAVELSLPVHADLAVLARLTAATVATRAGFDVEGVEDLRLAVDELCLSLARGDTAGRFRLRFDWSDGLVEIRCTLDRPRGVQAAAAPPEGTEEDLSLRILDALVDEHGQDTVGGTAGAWLRKRHGRASVG